MMLEHIQASTYHARRGNVKNAFRYGVDYVLTDLKRARPWVISINRFNLWSLWDQNHGGPRGNGCGIRWFRHVLEDRGFPLEGAQLLLLAQPSFLWVNFSPVSFWIALRDGEPRAFVAEVNSTFGQRHCYFCALEDFSPINRSATITAEKLMHVSPFQKVSGQYHFNFEMSDDRINIKISFKNGDQGVVATLSGDRKPATSASLLWAALRRPFGSVRILTLIHWQAAILYLKGAPFLKKQAMAAPLVSESRNFHASGK